MPAAAPARFNVLVPYAAFGWLPAGYSQEPSSSNLIADSSSAPTEVDRTAGSAHGGTIGTIGLSVYAKGACQIACLAGATGKAPDVNGRPALWLDDGRAIAWEYAPDAWASAFDSTATRASGAHRTRLAAGRKVSKHALSPVTAATRNLLVKVAGAVKYGQKTPLLFSFRLTSPLPAGWQLQQTYFQDIGGRLIPEGLEAGPAADTSALSVSAATQFYACNYVDGQSSYVTRDGVNWEYRRLDDHIAKNVEMLCSTTKVDGLQVNIYLDMAPEEAGAPPLPGSTQLGGAFGVYEKLRLLGSNPANWTASPLP